MEKVKSQKVKGWKDHRHQMRSENKGCFKRWSIICSMLLVTAVCEELGWWEHGVQAGLVNTRGRCSAQTRSSQFPGLDRATGYGGLTWLDSLLVLRPCCMDRDSDMSETGLWIFFKSPLYFTYTRVFIGHKFGWLVFFVFVLEVMFKTNKNITLSVSVMSEL